MFTVVSATLSTRNRGSRSRSTSRSVQVGYVEHPSHQPSDRSRRTLPRFHGRRLRPAHPWPATRSTVPAAVPRRVRTGCSGGRSRVALPRAAGLLVAGRGAVAGYAAAELWGASCAPSDEPAHVLMTELRQRRLRGLGTTSTRRDVPIESAGAATGASAYELLVARARRGRSLLTLSRMAARTWTPSERCGTTTSARTAERTSRRHSGCPMDDPNLRWRRVECRGPRRPPRSLPGRHGRRYARPRVSRSC